MSAPANPAIKLGLIFLGRKRPGFDMEWGKGVEQRVRASLRPELCQVIEAAEKAVDDASLRRVLEACKGQGAEVIVLLQTTMGDGRLAPTLAQLWPDPVVLWATPENPKGDMISSCSLVGAHCWASVLRQMGHPFEVVYGDPGAAETQQQLAEATRVAAAVRRLKSLRLGIIGGQSPGYFAMAADPFSMHRGLGLQVQTHSMLEFADMVRSFSDQQVAEDVERVRALKMPHKDTSDEDLPMSSRLYLAMRAFMEAEGYGALTIREWPELPNVFGQWAYLAIARLTEEGRAVACEGDADGAVTAWLGETLGFGRAYLTDWLEHDLETITVWHGGAAPMSLCCEPGTPGAPRIAKHFNIVKPAVVEATLRAGMAATLARIWRCDGKYLMTAREGRTVLPRRHLMGTNGVVRLDRQNPGPWFEELCHEGMPHHLVLFPGHHESALRRLARALRARFV